MKMLETMKKVKIMKKANMMKKAKTMKTDKKGRMCPLLLAAFLCLFIFSGCGQKETDTGMDGDRPADVGTDGDRTADVGADGEQPADIGAEGNADSAGALPEGTDGGAGQEEPASENGEEQTLVSLRIVDGAESGQLVLAGAGAGEVYTLNAGGVSIYLDGSPADAAVLEDGMTAEIAYGGDLLETYPLQFGKVFSVFVYSRGTEQNPGGELYDLCGLYLQVLNDLWDTDDGLNGGAAYVSVDLSDAPGGLTEGEKAAIAWIFAGAHQVEGMTYSYEELAELGYLTQVDLGTNTADGPKLYQWEDGVLFSVTASDWEDEEAYSLPVVKFDAEKWRSPLGAYFFEDCTAVWPELGTWDGYVIGGQAIS